MVRRYYGQGIMSTVIVHDFLAPSLTSRALDAGTNPRLAQVVAVKGEWKSRNL